jgi:hypothetical protein
MAWGSNAKCGTPILPHVDSWEATGMRRIWWCRLIRPPKSVGTICSVCGRSVRVSGGQALIEVVDGRPGPSSRHVATLCPYCGTAPFGELIATLRRDGKPVPDVYVSLLLVEKRVLNARSIALCERIVYMQSQQKPKR